MKRKGLEHRLDGGNTTEGINGLSVCMFMFLSIISCPFVIEHECVCGCEAS